MSVSVTIEKDELVIRLPLQSPTPSSSGKTLVIASSHGNLKSDAEHSGAPIYVGVNAYIKPGERTAKPAPKSGR